MWSPTREKEDGVGRFQLTKDSKERFVARKRFSYCLVTITPGNSRNGNRGPKTRKTRYREDQQDLGQRPYHQ